MKNHSLTPGLAIVLTLVLVAAPAWAGNVRLAAIGSFDTLNPFIIKGDAAAGIGGLYDSLTTASADEPFSRYGLLAESMEIAEDRSWIVFTLRPEARWHAGHRG
jgi:microcin C transport system substrate-binding protein